MSLVTLDMVRKRREFMCPLNRVVAIMGGGGSSSTRQSGLAIPRMDQGPVIGSESNSLL